MDAHKSAKCLEFAGFLHHLGEFGAGKYFTDDHTPYTIYVFGDSILVCKVHVCYCMIRKNFEQHVMSFLPIQPTKAIIMVRLDENKPLRNAFKLIALHLLIQIV